MPRERSVGQWFALSTAMLIVALAKAIAMMGDPYRLVNGVVILAFAFAGGAFFARGMAKKRMQSESPATASPATNVPE